MLLQPIARRVKQRPELESPGKLVIYGGFEFDHELYLCLDPMGSVMVAGTV